MTWHVGDSRTVAVISKVGSPPTDFQTLFGSETWSWIFALWAESRAERGDPAPYAVYEVAIAWLRGATIAEICTAHLGPEAPAHAALGPDLVARLREAAAADRDDAELRDALWAGLVDAVYDHWPQFIADLDELR